MFVGISSFAQEKEPVRFAIIGLSHDHARGFVPSARGRSDIRLVGIVEKDRALAEKYRENYKLERELFYDSVAALMAWNRRRRAPPAARAT